MLGGQFHRTKLFFLMQIRSFNHDIRTLLNQQFSFLKTRTFFSRGLKTSFQLHSHSYP